ncbi:MAG: type I 3-dehydroquinate dehydratase, partial [Planctomycetes bacterium]|nr:type I 3-dehydroquinate dehydratase [Planctomycetota bacterium]
MRLPFGLCVSVPLRSWDPRRVEAVSRRPGIVALEVRLDLGRARSIPARWDGPLPVVATCRPVREGGAFEGPEEERLELLAAAAGHGARWIDLEADSRVPTSLARVPTILSRHEVEGPSRVVEGLARWTSVVRSRLVPPVAVKWVVRGDDAESLRTLREWIALNPADALGCDWILFGAGPSTGVASRVLSLSLGGRWAYVALDEGSRTAPGQPTLDRFLADFGPPSPEPPRALYGVTGRDVSSSASPAMHNAWLRARGAGLYLPVSQDRWDLSWAAEAGFAGLNVTIPFKEHAAAVGDADGEARAIGAANLLAAVSSGGPWRASNTDATGRTRVHGLWRARVGEGDAALVLG